MRIVETEATAAEVLEAFTWTIADDQIGTELEHRLRGVVARVYDILKREEPEPDERRPTASESTQFPVYRQIKIDDAKAALPRYKALVKSRTCGAIP